MSENTAENQEIARIEHKPALVVAGLREKVGGSTEDAKTRSELWQKVSDTVAFAGVDASGAQQVSILFGANAANEFDYMAGLLVNTRDDAVKLGLNAAEVPAGEYAIVDVKGPATIAAITGLDYLFGTFLPSRGLQANGPAMEVFGPGDTTSEDYMLQVWVPIKAA